ncbi:MAG: hypothetical protein IIB00_05855, partial [candidate division Zixibacteria bacterium]|nr:hypothetical protein [candidate division Zixibacteria bacterium]
VFGMEDVSPNLGGYAGSDYLFVFYVNDRDPGAAVLGEGSWVLNALRVFKFGCVESVSSAVLSSSLEKGQAIDTSSHVDPGTDSTVLWILENIGKNDLTYSIDSIITDPPGNITLTGASGFISSGASNFDTLTLILNATKITINETTAHADIYMSGNFQTSPCVFEIDYSILDTSLCCVLPGDADGGGDVNIADAVYITSYAFVEGSPAPPCCEESDADGGGDVNIGDAIYIVIYIFQDGPEPVCPSQNNLICL